MDEQQRKFISELVESSILTIQNQRQKLMNLNNFEDFNIIKNEQIGILLNLENNLRIAKNPINSLYEDKLMLLKKINELWKINESLEIENKKLKRLGSKPNDYELSYSNTLNTKLFEDNESPLTLIESSGKKNGKKEIFNSQEKNKNKKLNREKEKQILDKVVNEYLATNSSYLTDKDFVLTDNSNYENKKRNLKYEKLTETLITLNKNPKLVKICENKFGKEFINKLLTNYNDEIFLNTFYDFLEENRNLKENKNSISSNSIRNNQYNTISSSNSRKKSMEIIKSPSHFRPEGNFSKKIFNNYTNPYGQFFDPKLQFSADSIDVMDNPNNSENNLLKKKENERVDFNRNMKICDYKALPWQSAKDFFNSNNEIN